MAMASYKACTQEITKDHELIRFTVTLLVKIADNTSHEDTVNVAFSDPYSQPALEPQLRRDD